MRVFFLILILFIGSFDSFSQEQETSPDVNLSGYLDLFVGYDFNKPVTDQRLPYLYHYNRHNTVGLNHGFIKLGVDHERYRANIGFHAGTYVTDNYSSEPDVFKAIYDANAGVALSASGKWWLDAGIFGASYLGSENTTSFQNWAASRSILSENVPYYITGIKISHETGPWIFSLYGLNGWQRIKRVEGNSLVNLGTHIQYGNDVFEAHWSTFIGSDDPDSTRRMRYFNDIHFRWHGHHRLHAAILFNFGHQQDSKGSSNYNSWYGFMFSLRYKLQEKWYLSGRYEYYDDPNGVIVNGLNNNPYTTSGISINLDYHVVPMVLTRIEGKYFTSPGEIYPKDNAFVDNNFFLLLTLAVKLGDGDY